jgi:hypothetical protein
LILKLTRPGTHVMKSYLNPANYLLNSVPVGCVWYRIGVLFLDYLDLRLACLHNVEFVEC